MGGLFGDNKSRTDAFLIQPGPQEETVDTWGLDPEEQRLADIVFENEQHARMQGKTGWYKMWKDLPQSGRDWFLARAGVKGKTGAMDLAQQGGVTGPSAGGLGALQQAGGLMGR
jgi:hypothetical protein